MTRGGKRPGSGKKKGSKAAHTLDALTAKAALIAAYLKKAKPINDKLLAMAEEGNIQAIKELHDRVYGKAPQDMNIRGEIVKRIIAIDE